MPSVRSSLRERLQRGETIAAPGAYDPLSARVVQALGFPAVYTGGYMTGAHTSITEPLLTLTEQVEVAQKVAHAVDLPVITDAGAGYGDPLHVMRCVREFEAAGIAGIHIEDQVYPKRASYHRGLEHIVPMQEFVERMTYALKARRDPDFLIIGRTDAFSAVEGSREELVRRGLTLKELGVDEALRSVPTLREALVDFGLVTKKTLDVNFINPFLTATMRVLQVQASVDAKAGKISKKEDVSRFLGDISGVIGLVSETFSGAVVISFPEKTFLKIMGTMLGSEYQSITKEIEDGAAELTNMVFGQAKITLNEKGAWLFICARDIFSESITQVTGKPFVRDLVLILNTKQECLGIGSVEQKLQARGLVIKNLFDIGWFVRKKARPIRIE